MTWNKACWGYGEITVHFQWEGRVCAAGGVANEGLGEEGLLHLER